MENTQTYDQNSSIFDEVTPAFTYASVGQRFLNYLIDLIVFYLLFILIFFFLGILKGMLGIDLISPFVGDGIHKIYGWIFSITVYIIFYTLIEGASKGRTVGKLVTGVKVVQEDGVSPITWKQAALRSLVRIVPFEPLSAFSGYPWHDKWTKTYVIKNR